MTRKVLYIFTFVLCALFVLCHPASAQLRVENDPHAEVPLQRAQLLLDATCRVVTEEFHVKHEDVCNFPVTVVLGNPNEHYEEDELENTRTIFLQAWSEDKFTLGIIRFSVLRLAAQEERAKLRAKIVARVGAAGTVSVAQLRKVK